MRDIMNISARRNPYVQLILYPATGAGRRRGRKHCKRDSYVGSSRVDVDVIIVGRGGGSIEDLWAFNEEERCEGDF